MPSIDPRGGRKEGYGFSGIRVNHNFPLFSALHNKKAITTKH